MNTNKTLRTIIQILLFIVPSVVLNVAGGLYFPYITGKAFIFRTLIIIATALYIILVLRDRSYLPKKSIVLWTLGGFVAVLVIATITSVDPARSFWSNFERMEGLVSILHLAAFFIISSSVLTGKQWFWLLHTSLFASILTGLFAYGDLGKGTTRIAGSLGNSTYLGVYALVHIFIAGAFLLGVIEKKTKKEAIPWVFGYVILIVFNLAVLYQTGTRGSFVGLMGGGLLTALLLLIFEKKNKTIKYLGGAVLALSVVSVILLGSFKHTEFVKTNPLLERFSSLITTDIGSVLQNQGYARTVLWQMAAKGFEEKPILGWGQDNFGHVFAKYYDPRMYAQEQWFDRSHNVFMDWLVAGGILALLGYLALFGSSIYMLWRKNPHMTEPWSVAEKATLTGMFIAYFIHNIFVFDNLISYILFFTLIAYIHERSVRHQHEKVERGHVITNKNGQVVAILIVAVLGVWTLNSVVLKPYQQGSAIIDALRSLQGIVQNGKRLPADPTITYGYFKKALAFDTYGNTETLERFAEVASDIVTKSSASNDLKLEVHNAVQEGYKKVIGEHPGDPRYYVLLGMYFERLGAYNDSLNFYKKALELSPNKQSFIYQVASAYISAGEEKPALDLAKKAYELLPENKDAFSFYVYMLIKTGDIKTAEILAQTNGGLQVFSDGRIIQALIDTKQYSKITEIAKDRLEKDPNNPQVHLSVAALYLKTGNKQAAIKEIQKTIELAPDFKEQGLYYISEIRAGRDPGSAQ